jgi:DNA-binding transcriptional LysR family regulator
MTQLSRLQRLDLHSLRLFSMVAKDGSITRAAERNHIAASALSRRLADLEHVIGTDLLVRSRSGVYLTDAGRVVLQHAERIQEQLRRLLGDAAAAQNGSSTVRLCASHSVVGGVLPELLRAFNPAAAQVRVEISECSSAEVIAACAAGRADVGIGLGVGSPLPPTVEGWTLWPDRLQVVMREDHLLARCGAVRFEQVLAFQIIGSNPAGALFQQLRLEALALGVAFVPQVSASNFSAGCRLAASGLGLAIMPAAALPQELGAALVRRPLMESWAERPVKVYASMNEPPSTAATGLLQHLRRQSRLHSGSWLDGESVEPAPRLEAQFAVAPPLPFARKAAVQGT